MNFSNVRCFGFFFSPFLTFGKPYCFFLVNRIKDQYKVSVRIPPDNEKSNLIRIEGDPQGVQEAKKELLELASRMVRGNNLCLSFLPRQLHF